MAQTNIIAGGPPTPNLGVTAPPGGASSTTDFTGPPQSSGTTHLLGMAVHADLPGDTLVLRKSDASFVGTAKCLGLIVKLTTPTTPSFTVEITERGAGFVELTTAQWDAITGDTGGLEVASTYYVSAVTPGFLTRTPPSNPNYIIQVGVAVAPTKMQLQIAPPVAA